MAFQFYDRDGDFAGGLEAPESMQVGQQLNEAGTVGVSAPYAAWRGVIPADFRMHLMELIGPEGDLLPYGRWLTCSHDKLHPGRMTAEGHGLLEELRQGCLPSGYLVSFRPVLEVLAAVLAASGTGWVLGDTSTASLGYVTASLEGQTYLGAVSELCNLTGNYFRHDGRSRVLDILTEPIGEAVAATLVCADADLEVLPSTYGYVENPQALISAAEVLCGVYPTGGEYLREDSVSEALVPLGNEQLPDGYSFQYFSGGLAVTRNAALEEDDTAPVTAAASRMVCSGGLLRPARFDSIAPLSNLEVSASGAVDEDTAGDSLVSEALHRPNSNFWTGGLLEVGGVGYSVSGHVGNRVFGGWGALSARTEFKIAKTFPYDQEKVDEARQALVDAAVGMLQANAEATLEVTLGVRGLDVVLHPGDAVRVECVGHVAFEDAMTMWREHYTYNDLNREFVVISVTAEVRPTGVVYQLALSDELRLLPTDVGVRELHELLKQRRYAGQRSFAVVSSEAPSMPYSGMLWVDPTAEPE